MNIQGHLVSYKILAVNESSSNRPFFSILFRDSNSSSPNSGSILFSKAALQVNQCLNGRMIVKKNIFIHKIAVFKANV